LENTEQEELHFLHLQNNRFMESGDMKKEANISIAVIEVRKIPLFPQPKSNTEKEDI
jgi:hypothetical protein